MVYVILLLGIFASSSAAIMIRLCDAHPFVIAAWRMLLAAAVLAPYALARHRPATTRLIRGSTIPVVASGVILALHFVSWISSLSHTSVASSALLVTTNPIFVGLGAWLIFRVRPGLRLTVGTCVALAGTFVISYGDLLADDHALFGDLLAIGGAIGMSGHLLIGSRIRRYTDLTPYIAVVYTVAAVVLAVTVVASGHTLTGHSTRDYLLFVGLAAGPQLLGHTSLNYALQKVSPSVVALMMLLEPIGSSLLAVVFLAESPRVDTLAGGFVILAGLAVALTGRKESTDQNGKAPPG